MTKNIWKIGLAVYLLSTIFFNSFAGVSLENPFGGEKKDFSFSATDLGVMCISSAYPSVDIKLADSRDNENVQEDVSLETVDSMKENENVEVTGEPRVLILHTHATESYLPASSGNFHTKE